MITNKLKFFVGMLFLLSFIFTIIFTIIFGGSNALYSEQEITKVDCYDEHNNKIIGLECEEITFKSIFSAYTLIPILVLSFSWITLCILHNSEDGSNIFGLGEKE